MDLRDLHGVTLCTQNTRVFCSFCTAPTTKIWPSVRWTGPLAGWAVQSQGHTAPAVLEALWSAFHCSWLFFIYFLFLFLMALILGGGETLKKQDWVGGRSMVGVMVLRTLWFHFLFFFYFMAMKWADVLSSSEPGGHPIMGETLKTVSRRRFFSLQLIISAMCYSNWKLTEPSKVLAEDQWFSCAPWISRSLTVPDHW